MDVSVVLAHQTTKAGQPRLRMKWTENMNISIIRNYFRITQLETNQTGYRGELHRLFREDFPNMVVTEQRVADQRRMIVVKNMLSQDTLNRVRKDVADELKLMQDANQEVELLHTQENEVSNLAEDLDVLNNSEQTEVREATITQVRDVSVGMIVEEDAIIVGNLVNEFEIAIQEFSQIEPNARPTLMKLRHSAKLSHAIKLMNRTVLSRYEENVCTFEDIHTAVYCGAVAVIRFMGMKVTTSGSFEKKKNQLPKWEQRLTKRIQELRRGIGRLEQYKAGNRSSKLLKHCQTIFSTYNVHTKHEKTNERVTEYLDTLKQKLSALAKRLRRYKACTDRKTQNKLFENNEKIFYRQLNNQEHTEGNGVPTKDEITEFWSGIWSQPLEHNIDAPWIEEEKERQTITPEMLFEDISIEELRTVIRSSQNWTAPGVDNIHNFWYKKFSSIHQQLATKLTEFIRGEKEVPEFMTEGMTYLKPKDAEDTKNPSKYRPITCLVTAYKYLTSCMSNKIYKHCETNNILAEEQKGCRKGSQGCKEQLIIDSVIMNQVHTKKRNIHTTFIDYKKAYDSVPHSWLIQVLEIYKISPLVINFIKTLMTSWRTKINLNTKKERIISDTVKIQRGIFQGDALSPLWFCLALNPLSNMLKDSKYGYKIKDDRTVNHTISHLLYMDDIKLYATTETHMRSLITTTEKFSEDICMEFGVEKCKMLNIQKGKVQISEEFQLTNGSAIGVMDEGDVYKYLGFAQARRIEHTTVKKQLENTYKKRMESILKTQLNGKNKIKAINTYAIPVLTYSLGIIKWTQTDIANLERLTRTTLTKFRMHHPKSAMERVTMPREHGGRGVIDLKNLQNRQVDLLRKYFFDKMLESTLHRAVVLADKSLTPLNLHDRTLDPLQNIVTQVMKEQTWEQKVLHGRHYKVLHEENVDTLASNKWLQVGELFGETEGFMIAIQDKIIMTKNYRKHIIKDNTVEDKCRKCHLRGETIEHIVSGCPLLAQTDYLHRHNQVANIVHQKLALKYKLIDKHTAYYKYKPQAVLDNKDYKLYYDRAVITDQTIHHNRPDIIITDKRKKETYLIDIAVPLCHNLEKTWETKMTKYLELSHEVKKMWKQSKVTIIPLVLSATGTIPRKLHNSIKKLTLPSNTYVEMQKAAIINTCSIVRKFLNTED